MILVTWTPALVYDSSLEQFRAVAMLWKELDASAVAECMRALLFAQ